MRHSRHRGYGRVWIASALLAALCAALPTRADVQPDPRPITWQNCALGGAAGGASKIASGGTAVTVANGGTGQAPLRGIIIQNPSTATESLFVDVTSTTASTTAGVSVELTAGQSFSEGPGTIGNLAITINAASSNHAFVCKTGQ